LTFVGNKEMNDDDDESKAKSSSSDHSLRQQAADAQTCENKRLDYNRIFNNI